MAEQDTKDCRFEEMVAHNRRRVLAIARSYAPPSERQDLCQEILLQMWKGLNGFLGESAPSTWVFRVALNTAITYRRKNGHRLEPHCTPIEDTHPEPTASSDPSSQVLILEEFLHSLGRIDRAVFLLYLEDLSYREISEITGLTENHIGVRINRLKSLFRRRYCEGEI